MALTRECKHIFTQKSVVTVRQVRVFLFISSCMRQEKIENKTNEAIKTRDKRIAAT